MTCNVQQQQQSQQRQQHSTTAGGRWKNGGGGKEIIRQLEESSDQRPDCYNVHSDKLGTSGVWSPHWAMVTSSPGPRGKVRPQIGSGGLMNHKETFILSLARHNMMKYKNRDKPEPSSLRKTAFLVTIKIAYNGTIDIIILLEISCFVLTK